MGKKILVALDGSGYSRKAIEYLVKMETVIEGMQYVLFNTQPRLSEYLVEDAKRNPKASAALQNLTKKNMESSLNLLNESKSLMTKLGVDEKNIEMVSQSIAVGTAKDILDYAKKSYCDAIVMGRRGLSRLAESFMGSVSSSVLEYAKFTPVWAIGGEAFSSKIMIAVDGSESALRAVDYVSFMIAENPDIKIILMHVSPRLRDYCTIDFDAEGDTMDEFITQGDKRCVDSFFIHARQRFREAGIKENQIDVKQAVSTINIGKTIVEAARKGDFGTLVIGRSGIDNSFFMGSVSRYVLYNASDRAVWLVP